MIKNHEESKGDIEDRLYETDLALLIREVEEIDEERGV